MPEASTHSHAALSAAGAAEAETLRSTAARLAEIDGLADTSALREVLLDLSYALASLTGPVGALLDTWNETAVEPVDSDVDALTDIAAVLRHCANNT
ncbi:hypothetical protein HZZ00_37645 (plasmid) [Streptomyces sp. NEAU-sy36]|uniref:hypothetical protein n=1 Tax=unclassified Streptomyces TaxID=2593676 RepID=UPI0015D5B74C|nr:MULTISPECIES: hypothetical protein [unclassified Streptomyces]QLJ06757.1 hypothetical protein HZZ00_37645 [Streptomyces sp. NEAU-sy36]